MRIERTKNASRNILFATILKLYQTLVPFLMRTAMVYLLGVEYLGLNSLFTSVLQVLNLAELGIGSAMVYSMYKPIAEDDTKTICALMNLYKIYYRVIGLVVAVMGLILLPFIPKLINGTVPADINVYILYLLNLGATVLSYWLFAYKNSILQAHQRTDVVSKVSLITETLKYICQIGTLAIFHNYYYYVIVLLVTQALNNVITAIFANKIYPLYKAKGKLSKENVRKINGRIKDLFTSKLGWVILNSADTIVISSFLGLTMLAIYQNYYYLITAVIGLVSAVFTSCTAGIGNSLVMESKEKNFSDFKVFTFIIVWIAGFCSSCFLCMFQPFMRIWMGKERLVEFPVIICFCIYFFLYEINQLFNLYKDAAGNWHTDRFRPMVTALVNLGINLLLVRYWGLYGIILSTVFSMLFVGMPWLLYNLFTSIFEKNYFRDYFKCILKYVLVALLANVVVFFICSFIELSDVLTIVIRAAICIVGFNCAFIILLHREKNFKKSIVLIDKMTKGKLKLKAMIEKS